MVVEVVRLRRVGALTSSATRQLQFAEPPDTSNAFLQQFAAIGYIRCMAKRKNEEPPRFEEALHELETIARELDEGALSLDESLGRFEQGIGLLRHCYAALDAAERKIALLTGIDGDGNPIVEPFDATATAEQGVAGRRKKRSEASGDDECAENSSDAGADRGLF